MIVVAGMISADILVEPVSEFPRRGTLEQVDRVDVKLGGCVGNTGAALAKLEVPVTAVSRLGTDAWTDIIRREVDRWAARYHLPAAAGERSPATIVFLHPDGTRSFLHAPGALRRFGSEDLPRQELLGPDVRAIHLGYALLMPMFDGEPMERTLREACEAGKLTSLDVAWYPGADWDRIACLLPYVDLFCPNYDEARAITGASDVAIMTDRLFAMGVRQVVAIKQGEHGAYVRTRDAVPIMIGPCHAGPVVDTTGAGDAFIAGMLAGWYRGLDWMVAARAATVAGGLSVLGSGAGAGLSDWAAVERRLDEVKVEKHGDG